MNGVFYAATSANFSLQALTLTGSPTMVPFALDEPESYAGAAIGSGLAWVIVSTESRVYAYDFTTSTTISRAYQPTHTLFGGALPVASGKGVWFITNSSATSERLWYVSLKD